MTNRTITEAELIQKAVAPRVTYVALLDNIKETTFFRKDLLTICVLTLKNGFTVVGESACAFPENYDQEIGESLATKDAQNKIWALMGYELKSKVKLLDEAQFEKTWPDQETYVGTKVVYTKPMNRLVYNQLRGWDLPDNENGNDEGYLVEYADSESQTGISNGYLSWSPKDVFERAYQKV